MTFGTGCRDSASLVPVPSFPPSGLSVVVQ